MLYGRELNKFHLIFWLRRAMGCRCGKGRGEREGAENDSTFIDGLNRAGGAAWLEEKGSGGGERCIRPAAQGS